MWYTFLNPLNRNRGAFSLAYKNYPLYETTVFEDFRIMSENVAEKYPDRAAYMYREAPSDEEPITVTFSQARDDIRDLGTALVAAGCR